MKKFLKKKINHLRQQHPDEQRRAAKIAAGVTTGIVVLIWLSFFAFSSSLADNEKKLFDTDGLKHMLSEGKGGLEEINQALDSQKELKDTYRKEADTQTGNPTPMESTILSFDEGVDIETEPEQKLTEPNQNQN